MQNSQKSQQKPVVFNKFLTNYQNSSQDEDFEGEFQDNQQTLNLSSFNQMQPDLISKDTIQQPSTVDEQLQNSLIKQSQLLQQNQQLKNSLNHKQEEVQQLQDSLKQKEIIQQTNIEAQTVQLRKENQLLKHQIKQLSEQLAETQIQLNKLQQIQQTRNDVSKQQQAIQDILVLSNLLLSQKLNIEPINTNINQIQRNIENIKKDPSLLKYVTDYFGITTTLESSDFKPVNKTIDLQTTQKLARCDDSKLQQAVIAMKKQLRLKHIELDLQYRQVSVNNQDMYSWFLYDKIVDLRLVNNKLMIKSGAGLIDFNEYLELIL